MKSKTKLVLMLATAFVLPTATLIIATVGRGAAPGGVMARPQGPCDVYAAGNAPCVAAHSSTRALYASYNGPLYQVMRQSDGKTQDIGVVPATATDPGGYANAALQDDFCANTVCWITTLYDQSAKKNHLYQAPHGGWAGPAMGGINNLPIADMAPVTLNGHKVYGVFISPGMGLRQNDAHGTAVDDQAEGQYWVINGHHYNSGCCFDYGNAETDSDDDGDGTMETTYYGNASNWYKGAGAGPWIMTDQENNLVGCANPDGSKVCKDLPSINWRFVTATADGEPKHWRTMGGDSQTGELKIMFDGDRPGRTYDPMRKQGAILLGNGGDNSNGSQGTFYEGAMTAANTMPSKETNQKLQANIVAAKYDLPMLTVAPAKATAAPTGLQTFTPGAYEETTLTFTNTTGAPATNVKFSLNLPAGWSAIEADAKIFPDPVAPGAKTIADTVAPGASVSATFKITSGPASFNGDLVANVTWTNGAQAKSEKAIEKIRNVNPIKINELSGSFIELFNASDKEVDLSNWSLTQHAIQQVPFSAINIPAGTKLAPKSFYLLGLSNSGLSIPAKKGDSTLYVRSVEGMKVGDTIEIGVGAAKETRKIASVGSAAGMPPALSIWGGNRPGSVGGNTIIWQPLPDGPVTFPVGTTNLPVHHTTNIEVGQKIAIGYGATNPAVARELEKYEVVTVTAVGKPGAQTLLSAEAKAGETVLKVRNAASLSVGDKIRLDIDTEGHGVETVVVKNITASAAPAGGRAMGGGMGAGAAGTQPATNPGARRGGMGGMGGMGGGGGGSDVELTAPLKFNHSANMALSLWGTGITFQPATAVVHLSNEPVLALGTGITLDKPLDNDQPIESAVRVESVKTAGYQGESKPHQWFGGPAISYAGAVILRDASGNIADSLNYGELVDPYAAEGYQATGGAGKNGCRADSPIPSPGRPARGGATAAPAPTPPARSAARVADGADSDSNCTDFKTQDPTPGQPNRKP